MAHWIKQGTRKGQVFKCSKCCKTCYCIAYIGKTKVIRQNVCDYEYCPRCGEKMEIKNG